MPNDMSEGYILRAVGSDLYYDLSVCLATSIRVQGDARPITIFVDNPKHPLIEGYSNLFDGVIDVSPYTEELVETYSLKTASEIGGIVPRLLLHMSPYNRSVMLDSDMVMLSSSEPLWNVSRNYNFTMIGAPELWPGWGEMSEYDIKVSSEAIANDMGLDKAVHLREVHAGITWFDKSETTEKVQELFKESLLGGKLEKYFPKVVKMWYGRNDEMALLYAMSVLDLPIVPYNRNLMSLNPKYFSVENEVADMGEFIHGGVYQLKDHMSFTDSKPVLVHFFKKANDSNFWKNRQYLYEWLNTFCPGINISFY